MLADAAAIGVPARATLEVRESNVAARRLYESLGFRSRASGPKYYSQPEEDALILWREDLAKPGPSDRGLKARGSCATVPL